MKYHRDRPGLRCLGLIVILFACGQGLEADPEDRSTCVAEALRITQDLEEQRLPYSREGADLQDCSGIFHRVLNELRIGCDGFQGPEVRDARSTRTIAAWYAARNRLIAVPDSLRQDDLIEPGMVLFYGDQNKSYGKLTVEQTLREIRHLGIVVAVYRNSDGGVESYRLFHGRSPGRNASVTYHGRNPSRKSHPALGNGSQQWIAAAGLCQDASSNCFR